MLEPVLVANRGEIARRVIRTLRALGIRSVAVYSDADRDAPHVREADEALRLGPAPAAESYLSVARLVEAALRSGAAAIHPGYGFVSESAAFARACEEAGLVFVGPSAATIELMGDKVRAKLAAEAAGVPVVPGLNRPGLTDAEILAWARDAPLPLLVKAAAGGGGRGMRVVSELAALPDALAAARREAARAFGDDALLVERFVARARHLEVQVIGDAHGAVLHLGERECSLQRRHQKVVEEAPSPVVGAELRARLGEEAVALARAAGYVGAGTVEFLASYDDPGEPFFLEMNARLQVEHPVTELVTGLDLVELQLRVAAGEPLLLAQEDVVLRGHAVEARVNAEDAAAGFLPSSGRVLAYRRPRGVRVDDAIEPGSLVTADYDSMVAKVIAHADDRAGALARLDRALAETTVLGVRTTAGHVRRLLRAEEVRAGALDTGLVERLELEDRAVDGGEAARVAALVHMALRAEAAGDDPFEAADGRRLGGERARAWWTLAVDGGEPVEVVVRGTVEVDGAAAAVDRVGDDAFAVCRGDGPRRVWRYAVDGESLWLGCDGDAWLVRRPSTEEVHEAHVHGALRAPMPGQVLLVPASVGDAVTAGQPIVVLESMKMELTIAAPMDGVVTELGVAPGDKVALDQPLGHVEAAA